MAGVYVDTSALGRVLLGEPDAQVIRDTLVRYDAWWASALLVVELRRLARREVERASRLDPVEVRSLDAIHLDTAVVLAGRGEIAAVLTYDHQLQAGCAHHGLAVEAPSAT